MRTRQCKPRGYCWYLGCILPKSASNDRANRDGVSYKCISDEPLPPSHPSPLNGTTVWSYTWSAKPPSLVPARVSAAVGQVLHVVIFFGACAQTKACSRIIRCYSYSADELDLQTLAQGVGSSVGAPERRLVGGVPRHAAAQQHIRLAAAHPRDAAAHVAPLAVAVPVARVALERRGLAAVEIRPCTQQADHTGGGPGLGLSATVCGKRTLHADLRGDGSVAGAAEEILQEVV